MTRKTAFLAALAGLAAAGCGAALADAPARRMPEPRVAEAPARAGLETAVFSGGCFWGVQGVFSHVKGVVHATSGYAGGAAATADYEQVSTGTTGHAESVKVEFDPKVVSYGELMRIFFSVALDPTQVGGQGPDEGSQYRSALWVADDAQRREAQAYVAQLDRAHLFTQPIATRVETLKGFYPAEAYHQDFYARHPFHPYILQWDAQKVHALQTMFPDRYASTPAHSA